MSYYRPNLNMGWLLDGFAPISLETLNGKAEMLSRIDNKYVVDRWSLERILPELHAKFDVLEIENRRAFTYETRYFDTVERSAYYEHHQGLRKGFKVRVRHYADAGVSFLEVKVKGRRGMTIKHRLPYAPDRSIGLNGVAKTFARDTYTEHYSKPFNYDLQPALDIRYKRITLVAKSGGERMTIDARLHFNSGDKSLDASSDVFIVETKSALGRGFGDKYLRSVHARPTKKCSKYCIGMAALGEVKRWNRFMPTMRRLGLIDGTELVHRPKVLAAA